MTPALALYHGQVVIPLDGRPVAIGRLPECDVMFEGWEVSRRHARIVPTPAGPLLVDRSRFGTFVNAAQVVAPLLLSAGDVIRVGRYEVRIDLAPPGLSSRASQTAGGRFASWAARFGPSEVMGAVAAVAGAWGAQRLGGGRVTMVTAAVLAETVLYYLALLLRDLRFESRERQRAGLPFGRRGVEDVLQNLIREFGTAELLDTLLLRPLAFWVGLGLVGLPAGILGGKLVADLLFYGPVLARLHWRLGSRSSAPREVAQLRSTQAMPIPTLGQLRESEDLQATTLPTTRDGGDTPRSPASNR
ncbi:MAG: FHA domain-containing protein [Gemmatimonadetes bacterium]|nr:FHA domain-containing protein [Gemmatimonadota bacterium]MBP9201520.1 FHA domain-containing protein [Gemmatimonadales bacterium]MBK6779703.1 FHA domain-containing protein [Gemmatimonadota bacterium]MBK7716320.1 FHA domain-containing protein [Gemmatimonadota bacterium]MBK7923552.1 FHA domain-containing protein [Gemmatimonadota bacterium]